MTDADTVRPRNTIVCQAPECADLRFSNLQEWFDHCDEWHLAALNDGIN